MMLMHQENHQINFLGCHYTCLALFSLTNNDASIYRIYRKFTLA